MKLRKYQVKTVSNCIKNLNLGKKVILAGCPGSGKTEMSIYIIKKMLDKGKRVLVLAHSTNVLKNNFQERWNRYYKDNDNLTICIPQSFPGGEYDFVVVDEAHENYLAKTVQSIVKDIPMQLLLTGTPSKLIYKGGFHIEVIAMEDVPREFFAKTGIELLSTCYKWTETDYTKEGNLKSRASITKSDTEASLDVIIDKLIDRVKNRSIAPEKFNKPGLLTRIKKAIFRKSILGKTMFVCSRKSQADFVNNYLISKGYKSEVSHSESDNDSLLFDRFKNNEFDVLVVVNRGRLGYSDDDLMNIIDMSGTKNPDLIYQMFARCVRGNQSQNKLFLKLAPTGEAMHDLTAVSVNMALSLMFRDIISVFNGKNMKGMFIPIFKNETKNPRNKSDKKERPERKNRVIFPQYLTDVIVELKSIRYSVDDELSIYKMGEIGEIIQTIKGQDSKYMGYWTLEKSLEFAKGCKGREELRNKSASAYNVLTNSGDLDKLFPKDTLQDSIEVLKKYKFKSDFRTDGVGYKDRKHYIRVLRKDPSILDEIFGKGVSKTKSNKVDRNKITKLLNSGMSGVDVARKLGISTGLVSKVKNGKK